MQKTFSDIIVRQSTPKSGCGIVEMIFSCCVICYWEVRQVDGGPFPELRVVHDRLVSVKGLWDQPLEAALRYGQKLADVIVESE